MFSRVLFLRSVNHDQVVQRYQQGVYRNVNPTKSIDRQSITVAANWGTDPNASAIFGIRTVSGRPVVTLSTDYELYNFVNTGAVNVQSRDVVCQWCRRSFKIQPNNFVYGIVTSFERNYQTGTISITQTGCYCDGPCALAAYIQDQGRGQYTHDAVHRDAEYAIKYLYSIFNNGKECCRAPDWRQHVRNGGALDDDRFYDQNAVQPMFVRMPNIVVSQGKVLYSS
jgi:hypothetical protein